ncbi:MAG: WecB/TagA/CpsF family glycosyltransferase [Pseudomonadota bacterium]
MAFGEGAALGIEGIETEGPNTVEWNGYQLVNASVADTVRWLRSVVTERGYQRLSFTSAHSFHLAEHDPYYATALRRMDGLLPDGSGVAVVTRDTGPRPFVRLRASQLVPRLLRNLPSSTRVFLLGANSTTARNLASNLGDTWPHLTLVGNEGSQFEAWESANMVNRINASQPDIVIVGMDAPRQEQWMDRHAATIHAPLVLGVGGLFAFMANHAFDGAMQSTYRGSRDPWRFHLKGPVGNGLSF